MDIHKASELLNPPLPPLLLFRFIVKRNENDLDKFNAITINEDSTIELNFDRLQKWYMQFLDSHNEPKE